MYIPNNGLTEQIKKIVDIYEYHKNELGYFEFLPPASKESILECERIKNIRIPESYKQWLEFSNGSTIDMTTAEFFSLKQIKTDMKYYGFSDEYVWIGSMIGDGEHLLFSKITEKFFWHDHGQYREYDNMSDILDIVIDILEDQLL